MKKQGAQKNVLVGVVVNILTPYYSEGIISHQNIYMGFIVLLFFLTVVLNWVSRIMAFERYWY